MQLSKRLKNFLVYLTLTSFVISTPVYADNVVRVNEGSPSPFTGWCLTDPAMAKIIADKESEDSRCQLKIDKEIELLQAQHTFEIDRLNIRLNTLQTEHDQILGIKDEEIKKLETAALKRPNDYWYLFLSGGVVIGVLSTVGIIYAVK